MFRIIVGRSVIGLSLAACLLWVTWTHGFQGGKTLFEPASSDNATVLPTGFLPTKPLNSSKPVASHVSAEDPVAYTGDRSFSGDFLSWLGFVLPAARSEANETSNLKSTADVDFGSAPGKQAAAYEVRPVQINQDLARAAMDLFSTSFDVLFSSLFRSSGLVAAGTKTLGAEDKNPFARANRNSGSSDTGAAEKKSMMEVSKDAAAQQASAEALQSSGNPILSYVFLGDWDGSGILQSKVATRINDTTFSFGEGWKTFGLIVNPAAVEQQRSLAIEDINGDEIADILVVDSGSLFGGVLSGDAEGNFALSDLFVTGYEPKLVTAGPWHGARREIIAVDTRSGAVTTFRFGDRFTQFRKQNLDFLPTYISRLVNQDKGTEHLLAAETGRATKTYQILDDDALSLSADNLDVQPSLAIEKDFSGRGELPGRLQVFQIGPYASIVLANATGDYFNVANLRLFSRIFVVVGDLNNDGTVDVGVARLK